MPAVARPPLQSAQLRAVAGGAEPIANDPVRHVPAFLNPHHAGSGLLAEARSMTISSPDVELRSASNWNVPTRVLVPRFELHANVLLIKPASLRQFVQRSPTPDAAATDALRARRIPHNRVTFFICYCLRNFWMWGSGGVPGFQSRGRVGAEGASLRCIEERVWCRGHVALPRDMTRHTISLRASLLRTSVTGRRPRRS